MLEFVRCHSDHIAAVMPQDEQQFDGLMLLGPLGFHVIPHTFALSCFHGPYCLGCGGIVDMPRASLLWALVSGRAGPYMTAITRKIKRVLASYPATVFEAHVATDFPRAERWVRMLGMRPSEDSEYTASIREVYATAGKTIKTYTLRKERGR